MIVSDRTHEPVRPMFAGVHGAGSPLGQPSIDATAQGGFWVTEPAHLGVDAHTAALRERLRDASMFARLSGLLRRAG